jgi:diguanylate cyclase (GGDEF)-like protein
VSRREPLQLSALDRIYFIARVLMATILVALVATDALRFGEDPHPMLRQVFIIGVALTVLAGVFALFARLLMRQTTERVLWEVLPFDVVAVGLLVWSTGHYQDPFYPWALGLSIVYAAVARKRRAWVVSGLAAATYLVAHTFAHATINTIDDYVLLVFKTLTLIVTGYIVADSTQRQSDRELRLERSQHDVGDLNEQLSRRLAELHAISEITEVIHSTLDFEQVGPLVLDILSKVIDMPSSCLFVIDKDKDETLFTASAGLSATAVKSYTDRWALSAAGSGSGDDLFACTTVLDHKRLMVVFCAPGDRLERMGAEDRLVLQAVASELVVAVENSQLYKLTKRLSITDELTGLNNYRYLQQRLDDEIERARRYSRSLSLLMLDADDFKRFNDTYGHIAGDTALAEMAEVLRAAVREIDVVCRYGGEEFSVILPETDAEGAFVVAEKIREAVSSHNFADAEGERVVTLTVSIGLATYPSTAADQEELLRQADDALYSAKNTGRDRVRAPKSSVIVAAGKPEAATVGEGEMP